MYVDVYSCECVVMHRFSKLDGCFLPPCALWVWIASRGEIASLCTTSSWLRSTATEWSRCVPFQLGGASLIRDGPAQSMASFLQQCRSSDSVPTDYAGVHEGGRGEAPGRRRTPALRDDVSFPSQAHCEGHFDIHVDVILCAVLV